MSQPTDLQAAARAQLDEQTRRAQEAARQAAAAAEQARYLRHCAENGGAR